jgi:predicted unusual protein kinase regulating ubiquinone biosynthesis (AarF/ABC1/UbiB family)
VYIGAVNRSQRRLWALSRARLSRSWSTLKRAFFSDEDVTVHTAPAELAEAEVLAREAASLRGGVAKLGQLRAYLDGTAPDARARLAALWDKMPADPPAVIHRVIAEELGQPPEQKFRSWEDAPMAAASLGQVHGAEDAAGSRLAVKVQYPAVAAALRDDLDSRPLLRKMLGADFGDAVDDAALERLRQGLLDELDYTKEAKHLERFAELWRRDPEIVIPRPREATRSVLVMERLDGKTLPDFAASAGAEERARVAETLFRFAFGSPICFGVFNADPHPGNYLVLDGAKGKLGFVDFGCVGELDEKVRAAEEQLWMALVHRDGEALRHAAHLSGLVSRAEVFEGETWREWEKRLAAPFLRRGDYVLDPDEVRRFVALTAELGRARRVALPAPVLLLWRQRLGALTVIASLKPTLNFRRALCELLDDGHHPIPLHDRYR